MPPPAAMMSRRAAACHLTDRFPTDKQTGILDAVTCPRCDRVAADDDRFCGDCGAELTASCRGCGRSNRAGTAFCTGCGALTETPAAGSPTEERRRVSVLFIDVVDSTPYAERADPELVRRMQAGFYGIARQVIGGYGGVVEKYIGDAVMAIFGAPVATETDPLRCVRAGLELQRLLSDADDAGSDADSLPAYRVGVATGEAIVDLAAARHGGQAIVAGNVVNTASRIQSVAPPGRVLVCGRTRTLTTDVMRYREHPPVALRGRSSPTEVWLALEPARPQEAARDVLPLIEREHELSLLTNALQRVRRDRTPQLVTIFGQPGIGKSRLVRELHRHAQRLGGDGHDGGEGDEGSVAVTWHTGYCQPFGENVTYAGLADIIKAEAGIRDTDPAETAGARLRAAVRAAAGAGDAERLTSALGPLVGLVGPVGLPAGDPSAKDAESAWRRFLVALAARKPTVLVFEDLHWADAPMRRFIELLAAGARDVPLLVLTTARPELVEHDPSWAGTITGSQTVTLPPLRSSGIAALYAQTFGQVALPSGLVAPLVELADGNPLYAQEYVRMLVETGSLPSAAGEPIRHDAALPTPDSVHAVIANRIDLLDPADRGVLQSAAVVGMQFWPGAVASVLDRPVAAVQHSLRRLEQRDFLSEQAESAVAGEIEFRFRHVLVRDVCYQRLPRTERVARHARAADWLDGLSHDRHSELTEVVAHHRSAVVDIAATVGVPVHGYAVAARHALHRAARRAYTLHALDRASDHTGRALSLLPGANSTETTASSGSDPAGASSDRDGGPESALQRAQLEVLAAEISLYRDRSGFLADGGQERLRALTGRLSTLGADREAARAWTLLAQIAWLRADRPTALRCLDRAVGRFKPLPDSSEKVDAYAELGRLHMLNYEREPAVAAAAVAAGIAERLGLVEAQANARITVATAEYHAGDPAALDQLRDIVEWCRSRSLLALGRATQNLANALLEEGRVAESVRLVSADASGVPGGHTLATGYSTDAIRAYSEGDLDGFTAAADAAVGSAGGGRWDTRTRGLRRVVRALRDEEDDGQAAELLAMARDSGFHRPLWTALATTALCRALRGHHGETTELLDDLVGQWRKAAVMASGAWVSAAAHASALAGRAPSEALRVALAGSVRRTPWGEAALHTATAAVALADGEPGVAGRTHERAADRYTEVAAATERVLSLALATYAWTGAAEPGRASAALAQVRTFAERNRTPRLLRLATHGGG